jgi:serine/threonine protein kinase
MLANDDTISEDAAKEVFIRPRKLTIASQFAGRYDVEALLGEGGMGAVYRVRDSALAEVVALKVLTLPFGGAREHAAMFRQEVKLSRRITHANVVHVFDIGEVDGLLYMTMELVEGITLRQAMHNAGGKLPFSEAIRVAHALANGLAAVHAQGIVHRDLKPGNVMICASGRVVRVVLADFGIASHAGTEDPAMRGRILGTISYMAPEQFAKQAPSTRTDLYSFGLVLLECLTGALPPRCDAWLSRNRKPIHVDLPAAGVAGNPVDVATIESLLQKCLDNDPGRRPASAEEMSRVLHSLLTHERSRIDIGMHSVERGSTAAFQSPRLPSLPYVEAPMDRTTNEVAEIMALGVPDAVAQDYVAALHNKRMPSGAHLVNAFELLESCVQRAPTFLPAIASRAVVAARCWFFDRTPVTEINWEQIATECVDIAIREAPELSDTHLAMGMLATQRLEIKRAARSLIRAVEIDPASHEAQEFLASIEVETGLLDRAMPRLVYAASAIPHRPLPCMLQSRCHALAGRYEEADALMAEAVRRTSIPTMGAVLYSLRFHAYQYGKRPKNLTFTQRKAIRENNWDGCAHYANILAGNGDAPSFVEWYETRLSQLSNPRVMMVLRQCVVEMLILLEFETKALDVLSDCARNGLIDMMWLDQCPLLAPLRVRDEFTQIRDWVWLNAYGVWS